jgi:uncharacterized protein (TIGR03000 family)
MNHRVPLWRRLGTALVAAVLAAGSAQAQSNGSQYPYWATAPQGYSGSPVTVPVPGMSPNVISNASQAPPSPTGGGVSLGGAYIPPSSTSRDLALPQRERADSKAHILLRVPQDAEIWVNGVKTKQTGESRYFFSPPLAPGKKYSYQMRVRWMKDGKPVEETQSILVHAGATIRRDFTRSDKTEPRP